MSDPSTILPPLMFGEDHQYSCLTANPANQRIFRVHPANGPGALVHGVGFLSYGQVAPMNDPNYGQFTGSPDDLKNAASAHVTQWKDGTAHVPSPFVSASCSIAYALFEAHRWNAYHGCADAQISVIDTSQITSDAWLATELVGAYSTHAAFFARWSEEVLVYQRIPFGAVVVTAPLSSFLDLLPRWCDDIKPQIQFRQLRSTEEVACALADAAAIPANNTPAQEVELLMQSVEQSIELLRNILPPSMTQFDPHTHAEAVDAIARLALVFVWWPKWITGVDPVAYPGFLQWARNAVRGQLQIEKEIAIMLERIQASMDAIVQQATA
ncbi:hypothetical protein FB451DRAFT_511312 [Mycena latifolia]|nr:hypothetical protein FB451DRAFT_511312 [Mycena latifolia]